MACHGWTPVLVLGILLIHRLRADQNTIDYLSENLDIKWSVVDNFVTGTQFSAKLEIANIGSQDITSRDWKIYMPSIRLVENERILPNGTEFGVNQGLWIRHINGDIYGIEAMSSFAGFIRGSPLVVDYTAGDWVVSRTDVMPNWYVTSDGFQPKTLSATSGESLAFVTDFTTPRQWKRSENDQYDPYSAQKRLELSAVGDLARAPLRVLPQAVFDNLTDSQLVIDRSWKVVRDTPSLVFEATFLAEKLNLTVTDPESAPTNKYIWLSVGNVPHTNGNFIQTAESYRVDISQDAMTVHVTGKDAAGVFYGVRTVLSIIEKDGKCPTGTVVDYPRFHYRGMHMDVARNFHSYTDVLRYLDVMSMYKMNKFHFHLTDDEGWRLEIPGLPELTDVGSKRCHDLSGDQCILPQLGAGPTIPNHGTGHFTTAQYKAILEYANERHIQVIPEFDMPGHCHATINSMLARYRKYNTTNQTMAEEFLLSDLEDTSDYLSVQKYTDNAVNPCLESTYHFVDHLMSAVVDLHKDIQALETFNFGGDEVPYGAWTESPKCKELMAKKNFNTSKELKQYFVERVAHIAYNHSLDLSAWEDGLMDGNTPFPKSSLPNDNVLGYMWDNVWEWGRGQRAYLMANADYKIVLSHATHFYFDFPYEPDPEERGYYWATRFTDTKKAFGYTPTNIYDNMNVDGMGNPINKEALCQSVGCAPLEAGKEQNVLGIQGQVWSETVRTSEQLDYMVFPRMLAVAERAWHTADWELVSEGPDRDSLRDQDWERFANTLGYKELARLDELKVNSRVPPSGARIESTGNLVAESSFPGLSIQYSIDNQQTWLDYQSGVTVQPGNKVALRTRSADLNRYSRVVQIENPSIGGGQAQRSSFAIFFLAFVLVYVNF